MLSVTQTDVDRLEIEAALSQVMVHLTYTIVADMGTVAILGVNSQVNPARNLGKCMLR